MKGGVCDTVYGLTHSFSRNLLSIRYGASHCSGPSSLQFSLAASSLFVVPNLNIFHTRSYINFSSSPDSLIDHLIFLNIINRLFITYPTYFLGYEDKLG